MVSEQDGRRLTDGEFVGLANQLLVGGNETTTSLITNAVVRLAEVPERWERLRREPELVDVAVEESLRFDPPVLGLFRTTTCPVSLHGVELPEVAKVMLLYAAANRDPAAFDDPNTFSLDRDPEELAPAPVVRLRHPPLHRRGAGPARGPRRARPAHGPPAEPADHGAARAHHPVHALGQEDAAQRPGMWGSQRTGRPSVAGSA